MLSNFINRLQRDLLLDFEPSTPIEEEVKKEEFKYSLTFEEWVKEFGVSSKYKQDTILEENIKNLLLETEKKKKELIIENAQLYNRSNQNKYIR